MVGFVTSSSPVSLKTRRVGKRCTLNLSRAKTSPRWCGMVVRRGGYQLRCRPPHLTMVQNDETKSSHHSVVRKFENEVPVQVSFSSPGRDSNISCLVPIALE
ncbi:uncharacterized protein TNCV_1907661 [Trichonephila clavipes]|nr:uncharacterized protein TNCV_1907661 [Trichonephila clavipes]